MAVLLCAGLYNGLTVSNIVIESDKIDAPIRIVLLTDLHSCKYGQNQATLLNAIDAQHPDLILMAGDMVDDGLPQEPAFAVFRGLAQYPCYYVTGNHEFWCESVDTVKSDIRACGITVLEGEVETLSVNGQRLAIAGIDDPEVGQALYDAQLAAVGAKKNPQLYTILLAHRPERLESYAAYGAFDLVQCGHAHGGQWRVPFPIYAPNQGFLPKYTSGLYELGGTKMVVSRGLARESTPIPRLFNAPEIVVIDLMPSSPAPSN
ncbi:MAG: metallophosphoesterase [Christensenellaceae bacterium]|nr:metallophosphoesterase [Christensenellaceae bacterium]